MKLKTPVTLMNLRALLSNHHDSLGWARLNYKEDRGEINIPIYYNNPSCRIISLLLHESLHVAWYHAAQTNTALLNMDNHEYNVCVCVAKIMNALQFSSNDVNHDGLIKSTFHQCVLEYVRASAPIIDEELFFEIYVNILLTLDFKRDYDVSMHIYNHYKNAYDVLIKTLL